MKQKVLLEIYQKLFDYYGPQHWWPADSILEMMLGAILTQNTSWSNVKKAIQNLQKNQILSLKSLLEISTEDLARAIQSAGYFNLKAQRLKNLLQYLSQEYDGDFERMKQKDLMALRKELLSVKGVGPETADSILLYGLDKNIFVIDQYTYRVLNRHLLIPEESDYESMQELMTANLPEELALYKEYHALLVKVGNEFCKSKARCEECPLKGVNGV